MSFGAIPPSSNASVHRMTTRPLMKEPLALTLVLASALAAGTVIWLLAHGGAPPQEDRFKWVLLAMGLFSLATGLFDRAQKPDFKRINRVEGLKLLLGPTGSRVMWAVIGGGFLGGAVAVFLRSAQ
jgi:hypothetical protein